MKRILVGILVAAGVIGMGYLVTREKEASSESAQEAPLPLAVSVMRVDASERAAREHTFAASIASQESAAITASVPGTVTRLFVRLGDRVAMGQTVALIETAGGSVAASDSGVRSAEVSQAELRVAQLKKIAQEAKRVYEKSSTHANKLAADTARLNYESAQISLRALLDGNRVKSSIAGTVMALPVSVGESVSPGQKLMTVGRPDKLKVTMFVSRAELSFATVGTAVEIAADDGTVLHGSIVSVAPQADPATGKFLVEVRPEASLNAALKAGTTAKVTIIDTSSTALEDVIVPLEAVLVGQNESTVFVLPEHALRVEKRTVDVKRVEGGEAFVSRAAFLSTDRIVTSLVRKLDSGMEVSIR